MAIADKFRSVLDFVSGGFQTDDIDDGHDYVEEESYPTEDNLARKAMFNDEPRRNMKVIEHPNFKGYEVLVSEPRSYEDSMSLVQQLKDKKTVILNLHLLDKEQAIRIVDFLCGATHALNGNQQKIGDSVFIFTPTNVSLSAESQKSKFIRDALWNQD